MTDSGFGVQDFARSVNELLVLSVLRKHAKHGYQIARDVDTESNGRFILRAGTLYPILHRMEGKGFILGVWKTDAGRRRRVYSLSRRGAAHRLTTAGRVHEFMSQLLSLTYPRPDESEAGQVDHA